MIDAAPPDSAELRRVQRLAVTDIVPLFIPAIPFGFVLGLAIVESPMPDGIGLLTSPVVFAGAAQLALVTLVGTASVWAAIAAALVINSRHIMYSAAMAPVFAAQPRWFRRLAPFMLIDQVFALSTQYVEYHPDVFRRYYLTTGVFFYSGWSLVTGIGMYFGSFIPASWQLGYAPAVMFLGLVVLSIDRRPALIAAVVGASVCFATIALPNRVGLIVGALCGVIAGFLADREPAS